MMETKTKKTEIILLAKPNVPYRAAAQKERAKCVQNKLELFCGFLDAS